jgi:hypothetical protein
MLGKERIEAMLGMQKELVDAYEQASRAWLARVKLEVEFWSDLTTKLGAAHSAPEALETYQKSAAQRMQMAADDGRRLSEDCQKIMHKMTGLMSTKSPTGST